MSMTNAEFEALKAQNKKERLASGLRHGPCYSGKGDDNFGAWYDQFFQKNIAPAGEQVLAESLRVGSTQQGLEVVLLASHANTGKVVAPAGSTITLITLQADSAEGAFEEIGPSICIKAPADGITAAADHVLARFAIGNFSRPWLKIKLSFAPNSSGGAISGGKIDACLGYQPR